MKQVGETIWTEADYSELPVHSVMTLRQAPGHRWVRDETGWRSIPSGTYIDGERVDVYALRDFEANLRNGQVAVHALPVEEGVRRQTLLRYKWLFRDLVRKGSQDNGGTGRDAIANAMSALEMTDEMFPWGTGQEFGNVLDFERLPVGSTFVTGDLGSWSASGLYLVTRMGQAHRLLGGQGWTRDRRYVVDKVEGERVHQAWLVEPGTDQDDRAIVDFKIQAWHLAMKAKSRESWCGAIEAIMSWCGIDQGILAHEEHGGFRIGAEVDRIQAAALPPGTILRRPDAMISADRPQVYYVRVNDMFNTSRTRIATTRERGSAPRMVIVSFPDPRTPRDHWIHEVSGWPDEEFAALPPGTQVRLASRGEVFTKFDNGRWSRAGRDTGEYNDSQLGEVRFLTGPLDSRPTEEQPF